MTCDECGGKLESGGNENNKRHGTRFIYCPDCDRRKEAINKITKCPRCNRMTKGTLENKMVICNKCGEIKHYYGVLF